MRRPRFRLALMLGGAVCTMSCSTSPSPPPAPPQGTAITLAWDRPAEDVRFHDIVARGAADTRERRVYMPETQTTMKLVPGRWTIEIRACSEPNACSAPTVIVHEVK